MKQQYFSEEEIDLQIINVIIDIIKVISILILTFFFGGLVAYLIFEIAAAVPVIAMNIYSLPIG